MTLLRMDGRSPDTRPARALITGDALAEVWPEVSTRLGKLLTSRGACRDVAEDVVQEVAARALQREIVFDDAADLMRWAVPVALNLLVDNARAAGRVTVGIDGWDAAEADVADLVAHRDRLDRVLGAVARLSDADRAALALGDAPTDRREAVRMAVRRHRARRRLLALVDGVAGIAGLVAWLGVWARRSRGVKAVGVAAVPVAFMLPVALVLVGPAPVQGETEIRLATRPPRVAAPERVPVRPVAAVQPRAPRPARPAVTSVAAPARTAAAKPAAPETREVMSVGPSGRQVHVVQRPPTQDDRIVCIDRVFPVIGKPCVGERP